MFTIKAIGPDGQTHGFEATRFQINEGRSLVALKEPGAREWMELDVLRPDGLNHVYVENAAGKTVETLHRGVAREFSTS